MCYNDFAKSARFLRLPAVALAKEGALQTMRRCQAVLLTLPSDGHCPLWSYPHTGTLPRLISFVSHSYENTGGVGVFFPFWNTLHATDARRSRLAFSSASYSPPVLPFSPYFVTSLLPYFVFDRHRDENPVTATPLDSALTNCDARNPFRTLRLRAIFARRIRFYEGVSLTLCSLFSLFTPRVFNNHFAIKWFRTLSKNRRVVWVPFHSGTRLVHQSRITRLPELVGVTSHVSLSPCPPAPPSSFCSTSHQSRACPDLVGVISPATLFPPWLANVSANTFSRISIGAKRSRAPSAFRRIPPSRSRRTINIAGSKLAPVTAR